MIIYFIINLRYINKNNFLENTMRKEIVIHKKMFEYIEKLPKSLDKILNEIEKLNTGKLNYSIQELQTMDVLLEEKKDENERILKETNDYINLCNSFLYSEISVRSDIKEDDVNIQKKEIYDNVDINLSDIKSKIFTLANVSFKANKLTKVICERAIEYIVGQNRYRVKNENLKKVIKKLESIYRNSNAEDKNKFLIEGQLSDLSKEINSGEYDGWNVNFVYGMSDEENVKMLYSDLCKIWNVREVLYEIKSQLNTELIRCLIQDNYNEFKKWGFRKDENNMWVLNIDHHQIVDRYGYHVPNINKVLSNELIEQLERQNFHFDLDFTSIVRKTNLNIITQKIDGNNFLEGYKSKLIKLLKEVDLENYKEDEYNTVLELYTLGKFLSVGTFNRLSNEHPELREKFQMLKKLYYPSDERNVNILAGIDVKNFQTKYEADIKRQIEEKLANSRKIYIQNGKNLDIEASIYALKKHMLDKFGIKDIKVIRIDAGKKIHENGLYIDAGLLDGINGFDLNYKGKKTINANVQKAQKSACGVLKQYGFYVPDKIVQYADTVISDERILIPRYGLNVIRYLKGKKLFEFAEEQREDGTYLIETELTDDELEKYSTYSKNSKNRILLKEQCDIREKEIERDTKEIMKNIYVIHTENGDKHAAIVDHIINCGAMISFSLGCDYYASVATQKADFTKSTDDYYKNNLATFSVAANPKKDNGKLPNELLEWCRRLRDNGEDEMLKMVTISEDGKKDVLCSNKPFVKDTEDIVVFGGPKTPHLFVTFKKSSYEKYDIKEVIINEITDKIGAKVMKKNDNDQFMKESIKSFNNIDAKTMAEKILSDIGLTLGEIEKQGTIIKNISKEKEKDERL